MTNNKPLRGSGLKPDHIMLSIKSDPETSMTVTWRTSVDAGAGYVEYHEKGKTDTFKAFADTDIFKSDIDISTMHWATLTGLKPGAEYEYTCGDDKSRSGEYSFRTKPEGSTKFRFLCVSDQQKGEPFECPDYSHFNKIVRDFLDKYPDTAFILGAGDSTDCGQHEVQWNGAFSGLVGISEYVPFMMALGNHDNRGFEDYKNGIGRYYAEPAEFFNTQFRGSYNYDGPENWKTENYSFDYGNAHICAIGINGPEEVNDWLIDNLKNSSADWKIGAYHFPICYTGSNLANYDAYPIMTESMEMLDLLFSGHEHSYGRSYPRRNEELSGKPSEGTIHFALGNSNRNPPGTRSLPKVWHSAWFPMEENTSMLTMVEVDGKRLTVTALLEDGRIADRCVIDKETDTIEPRQLPPVFNTTRMMFKGADLGLCQAGTPCENIDGVWYACLPVLFSYFGGEVIKKPGAVYLSAYGHSAEFTLGSKEVKTEKGVKILDNEVLRLHDQLYIPLDAVDIFDMRWAYAKRNNFILIEIESEAKPITVQP